jgi:hypothetical protein
MWGPFAALNRVEESLFRLDEGEKMHRCRAYALEFSKPGGEFVRILAPCNGRRCQPPRTLAQQGAAPRASPLIANSSMARCR